MMINASQYSFFLKVKDCFLSWYREAMETYGKAYGKTVAT